MRMRRSGSALVVAKKGAPGQPGALSAKLLDLAAETLDPDPVELPGGPTVQLFSGLLESVVGDQRTVTAALDAGVPSTYLIRGIDRLLNGGLVCCGCGPGGS